MGPHMHAVATKAVAGTVTGLPIRRVPRAKTDEAKSAFALVVHGSSPRPSVSALVSLHGIAFASHLQSHHLMLSTINHFAIIFSFFKSSQVQHAFVLLLIHPSTHTRLFYHYRFYPALDFFFRSHYVPPPPIPTHQLHLRPGSRPFMTTAALFILISKIGLGTVWTG